MGELLSISSFWRVSCAT